MVYACCIQIASHKDFDWAWTIFKIDIEYLTICVAQKSYMPLKLVPNTKLHFNFFFRETFKISKCWKVPRESEESMAKMRQCDGEEAILKLFLSLRIVALCIFFLEANCNQYYTCYMHASEQSCFQKNDPTQYSFFCINDIDDAILTLDFRLG